MNAVVFFHIPKTAGTSVHRVIYENLGPIVFYRPRADEWQLERFGASVGQFEKKLEEASQQDRQWLLDELNNMPAIGGHTPYGVMSYLVEPRFKFTSFRDPRDRLISLYFHHIYPEKKYHVRPYSEQLGNASFEQFLKFEPIMEQVDNRAVRFFSDCDSQTPVNEGHLLRAKRNIERLDFILFQSSLLDDLNAMAKRLGWNLPEEGGQTRLKVSSKRERFEKELNIDETSITPYLEFDRQLYDYAKSLKASRAISGCY